MLPEFNTNHGFHILKYIKELKSTFLKLRAAQKQQMFCKINLKIYR